jgi:hypothetical protein
MLNPVIEVAVRSADLWDVAGNLFILAGFMIILLFIIKFSIDRQMKSTAFI